MEIKKEQILKGIKALKEVIHIQNKNEAELFETVEKFCLQFSLIKIFSGKEKILRIELPHKVNSSGTCLFVADVDKTSRWHEDTTASYEKLLLKHQVTQQIDIIPIKRVKLEYSDYESKRNLSNFYDVFLCDARIIRLMPELLGKHFVGRKKFLVQVHMDKEDLSGEIDRALSSTTCALKNRGATSMVTFGDMSMSDEELTENLEKVLNEVVSEVRGGWGNLRSVLIKGKQSLSVPIYQSTASKDSLKSEKKGGKVEEEDGVVKEKNELVGSKRVKVSGVSGKVNVGKAEEISTVRNARVLVTESGDVVVIENKKGVVDGGDDDEDEDDDEEEEEEEEDDEEIDYEMNGTKTKRVIKEKKTRSAKKIKLDSNLENKKKNNKQKGKEVKSTKGNTKEDKEENQKDTALLKKEASKDTLRPRVKKLVVKKNVDLKFGGVKLVNYNGGDAKKGQNKLKRKTLRIKSLKKKAKK